MLLIAEAVRRAVACWRVVDPHRRQWGRGLQVEFGTTLGLHSVVENALLLLSKFPFTDLDQTLHLVFLLLVLDLDSDGSEEGFQMREEIFVGDLEIPVEEEEKLPLHQVDLCNRETKAFVAPDATISRPVLVLRT